MTVWYLPIEPYEERYTVQLRDWTLARFAARGVHYREILGQAVWQPRNGNRVTTGVALDAHFRTMWGLDQVSTLIGVLQHRGVDMIQWDDVIYTQDLYQPGYDALLYVLEQQFPDRERRPRIFTHNLAQTIDPDDFTSGWKWMRSYEWMVDQTASGVFYASTEHAALARVAGFTAPRHVVGLLHDRDAVRSLYGFEPKPIELRSKRIVYTSRFDAEKQPHFFLDLVEWLRRSIWPEFKIQILTGAPMLRSNDPSALERVERMETAGLLEVVCHLDKRGYYALLADSRLQINTARQDWVSNTLLESSALGTPTLAPAYRGFPEALFNFDRCLYVPWSLHEACTKAQALLNDPPTPEQISVPSLYHDRTLDRVIDVLAPSV
jgi:glycosyltransferase involved in cell wall biosynthesis